LALHSPFQLLPHPLRSFACEIGLAFRLLDPFPSHLHRSVDPYLPRSDRIRFATLRGLQNPFTQFGR
jgi:hypothetical protein